MYIEMLKEHLSSFLSNILVQGRKQANNFKVALLYVLFYKGLNITSA